MYHHRETNPYFLPSHVPPLEHETQQHPQHRPFSPFPQVHDPEDQTHPPLHGSGSHFQDPTLPVPTRHQPQVHPKTQPHSGDTHVPTPLPPRQQPHSGDTHFPTPVQPRQQPHSADTHFPTPLPPRQQPHSGSRPHSHRHSSGLVRVPTRRKTTPFAWLIAGFCALFWIMVIVAGLAILIIYLVFRPRNPKFDITSATLNAAYLDMGYLLNADITVLANFTNPNKKGRVDFHYAILDLYHGGHLLASSYIDPFSTMNHESRFQDVHLVSSQVRLPLEHSQQLKKEVDNGRVKFEVKGLFRARSNLGSFLQYSYWLYSQCTIVVTSPPTGALIGRKCITKR